MQVASGHEPGEQNDCYRDGGQRVDSQDLPQLEIDNNSPGVYIVTFDHNPFQIFFHLFYPTKTRAGLRGDLIESL